MREAVEVDVANSKKVMNNGGLLSRPPLFYSKKYKDELGS
jgi:hypothetical protein